MSDLEHAPFLHPFVTVAHETYQDIIDQRDVEGVIIPSSERVGQALLHSPTTLDDALIFVQGLGEHASATVALVLSRRARRAQNRWSDENKRTLLSMAMTTEREHLEEAARTNPLVQDRVMHLRRLEGKLWQRNGGGPPGARR